MFFLLFGSLKSTSMKLKIKCIVFLITAVMAIPVTTFANTGLTNEDEWASVMDAIIQVESGGNPQARSGICCGPMQISPVLVAECNNILRRKNTKKRFKLSDRFNLQKSKEMFVLFQSVYNPYNNVEKAIRMWNGGLRYSVRATQRYYEKVMRLLK